MIIIIVANIFGLGTPITDYQTTFNTYTITAPYLYLANPEDANVPPAFRTYIPPHYAEATIEVHNVSPYPIMVSATGKIVDGNINIRHLLQSYQVKWQGVISALNEIPSGDTRRLNVVAYGRPKTHRVFFNFSPYLCLNFLIAEKQVMNDYGYFTEGCQKDWWLRNNDHYDTEIQLEIVITATSLVNASLSSQLVQIYIIKPGDSETDIQFGLETEVWR